MYNPSSLRMPSKPCSGRGAPGSVESHFGPPTAARRTASEALAASSVASGSGSSVASIAAPPMRESAQLNSTPYFEPTAFRTFTPSAMISGPMPSPGKRQMLYAAAISLTSFNTLLIRKPILTPLGCKRHQTVQLETPLKPERGKIGCNRKLRMLCAKERIQRPKQPKPQERPAKPDRPSGHCSRRKSH